MGNSWNDYGCNERIRYKMDKNMIMLPGTAAMLPYLTHGKAGRLMLKTGREKREKVVWQPAVSENQEKAVLV